MRRWLRSLNPQLPRAVQLLQLGGLANAFGNGAILPFVLIYLHNVQGIGLGTAGLVLATNAFVSIGAGPVAGTLVDRVGGKRVLRRRSSSSRSATPATSSSTAPGRASPSRP